MYAFFAAATADIGGRDRSFTVGGTEQIDVVFEESHYRGGFEQEGDIFIAAGAISLLVDYVALFEVGVARFGCGAVGED